MSFLRTTDLLTRIKAALESLPLPGGAGGEKLFERVDFHENKKLREALSDLVIVKQRVAIVVPGGHSFVNVREGRTIRSVRTSTFDIIAADRAWTKGGQEAVFGGPNNVGVLTMGDIVVDFFAEHPQLAFGAFAALPYVALTSEEAALIEIADTDAKDSPGRQSVVIHYATPSGEREISPTARPPLGTY